MDFSQIVVAALGQLLTRLPVFLVWIAALVFALTRWRQHPRVSMLVTGAVAVFVLETIVNAFVVTSTPMMMHRWGMTVVNLGVFMMVYGIVSNLIAAVAWGMMIAAAFGWRTTASSST